MHGVRPEDVRRMLPHGLQLVQICGCLFLQCPISMPSSVCVVQCTRQTAESQVDEPSVHTFPYIASAACNVRKPRFTAPACHWQLTCRVT